MEEKWQAQTLSPKTVPCGNWARCPSGAAHVCPGRPSTTCGLGLSAGTLEGLQGSGTSLITNNGYVRGATAACLAATRPGFSRPKRTLEPGVGPGSGLFSAELARWRGREPGKTSRAATPAGRSLSSIKPNQMRAEQRSDRVNRVRASGGRESAAGRPATPTREMPSWRERVEAGQQPRHAGKPWTLPFSWTPTVCSRHHRPGNKTIPGGWEMQAVPWKHSHRPTLQTSQSTYYVLASIPARGEHAKAPALVVPLGLGGSTALPAAVTKTSPYCVPGPAHRFGEATGT